MKAGPRDYTDCCVTEQNSSSQYVRTKLFNVDSFTFMHLADALSKATYNTFSYTFFVSMCDSGRNALPVCHIKPRIRQVKHRLLIMSFLA